MRRFVALSSIKHAALLAELRKLRDASSALERHDGEKRTSAAVGVADPHLAAHRLHDAP